MIISWFSAGVSSFIATYIERDHIDKILYTHIDDQHPDSMRFLKDCERVLGKEIDVLQSKYKTVNDVIRQFRFINGPYGAKCTDILKRRVRKEWEYGKDNLTYIWGYDIEEKDRAERLLESKPQFKHKFPLIERQLTKEDCHGILRKLGIKRPMMYELGYRNNNCIGCVKGGMGYWNRIRKDFPEVFKARAELEREIGASCIKDVYLDELEPNRGRLEEEVIEECNIICQLQSNDLF
ncbi:MAG: phosphoadenosine phosphosulfate reductase [Clostridia bacterium]|nr:phosphoadenosine phosphosulfate reductase [Clostridia bacterium]